MKLSTRRKLTTALAISCVCMMIFIVLQRQLQWGNSYSVLPETPIEPDPVLKVPLKESSHRLDSEFVFQEINNRSLFSKDRTAPLKVSKPAETTQNVPKVPLTAQLTGIVLTPNRKVALLRNAGGDQSFRLREGMPFPGELAGWRVVQINARSVIFDGGEGQGQVELKLDVAKGAPTSSVPVVPQVAGAPPVPPVDASKLASAAAVPMPAPGAPPPPPPPPSADQAAREAEVQRIIEERRAQMRAEAERLSSGKQ